MLANARQGTAARQQGLKLGIDEVGIELGRSCERLFRLDGGCICKIAVLAELLVVLSSDSTSRKLSSREAVEDDVGNAGERRLEGSNRRRKLLALGIAIAWTNSAAKPHEVDSSA